MYFCKLYTLQCTALVVSGVTVKSTTCARNMARRFIKVEAMYIYKVCLNGLVRSNKGVSYGESLWHRIVLTR